MYVSTCPLSEFITKKYIYLTLKWSKGLPKTIHLGANEELTVNTLAFRVNPKLPVGRWSLLVDKDKAIFQQNQLGNIELKILDNISLECTENVDSESYIHSEFSRYLGKDTTEKYARYIKISRININ